MSSPIACTRASSFASGLRRDTASAPRNSRRPPSSAGNGQQVERAEVRAEHPEEIEVHAGAGLRLLGGLPDDADRTVDLQLFLARDDPPDGDARSRRRRRGGAMTLIFAACPTLTGSMWSGMRTWMRPSSLSPLAPGVTVLCSVCPSRSIVRSTASPGCEPIALRSSSQLWTAAPLTSRILSFVWTPAVWAGPGLDLDPHARLVRHLLATDEQAEEDEHRREEVVGERPGGDGHDARPERQRWRSCRGPSGRSPRTGSSPRSARRRGTG